MNVSACAFCRGLRCRALASRRRVRCCDDNPAWPREAGPGSRHGHASLALAPGYPGVFVLATVLLAAILAPLRCQGEEPRDASQPAAAAQPEGAPARPGKPLMLDDKAKPLRPKTRRTEQDQDRLEALSLFAAARSLERRGDDAEALQLYERAFRWDPQSVDTVRSIIPLACRLKRFAEAVYYALQAEQIEDADPVLLRRLGAYLTDEGDWKQAAKLYQRALAARDDSPATPFDVLLRMELGRLYHLMDQWPKAADCFAYVVHALEHPQDFALKDRVRTEIVGELGPAYNLFGEAFLLAERPKEATAAFEKAYELAPNKGLLRFNLARVYARTGKPEEALAALEDCFAEKLSSEGVGPYELLGEVLDKLGKKGDLIPRLEKLRAGDAENVPLTYYLAGRYRDAEQFDKAEALYRQLLQKNAGFSGYRHLAEIYRKTGRIDALLGDLGEAVEKTGALEALGTEAQTIAGDAALIGKLLQAAGEKLREQPEKPDFGVCFAAALLALEVKNYDTAGEMFEAALKAKPEQAGELLVVWGVGLLLGERPAEAIKVFQRGIDQKVLPDDNPILQFYLAGALEMDNRTDDALAAARKAAETKPDSARFQSREAWVLDHAKRQDEAANAYAEVIDKFNDDFGSPETRDVLRLARLSLSNLCVLQGNIPQAEEWLNQVLDEFPDDAGANNDLGFLWADQGKHLQRALKMVQLAVDAEPDNTAYRDSLGWVLYRLKRYPEAVAELEKAASGKPEGVILDHLGDAYMKVNERQKAKDSWQSAVAAFQKESDTGKAKQVKKKIKNLK